MILENLKCETRSVLEGFEQAYSFDVHDLHKPSTETIVKTLIEACSKENQPRLVAEFFGHGPLTTLIEQSGIQEIVVNGADEIWYEKEGQFQRLNDTFLSELTFRNFIDRLCMEAQVKIDLSQPFVDGRWQDFRLHLACSPLTHCAYHVTLRRMPVNPWTLDKLHSHNWCTIQQLKQIQELIHTKKNVLVIGPTGCGKTSVLGACLKELEPQERVVILEDTDELTLPNQASTKMLSRTYGSAELPEISLTDLVKQSLRMRPFRLVVGEVRGSEAKDLLLALATGHSGSWGTLHASDPRQALLRLEMLIQLGAPQWGVDAIRQLLKLSVDALIVCKNENGHRSLEGIYKVAALESFGFLLEPWA